MTPLKDETGKRYGRLLVLRRDYHPKDSRAAWLCKCDCGNAVVVMGYRLRNKDERHRTRSCGCFHREQTGNLLRRFDCPKCRGALSHDNRSPRNERCPLSIEEGRANKRKAYWADVERSREKNRNYYHNLSGLQYNSFLLKGRRRQALRRLAKRQERMANGEV